MDKAGKLSVQGTKKDNSCQLCSTSYSSKQELKEHFWSLMHHIQIETTNKNMPHNCTVCFTSCSSLAEYGNHLNTDKHKTALTVERKVTEERNNNNNNPPPQPPPVPRKKTCQKDKSKPQHNESRKEGYLPTRGGHEQPRPHIEQEQDWRQNNNWYDDRSMNSSYRGRSPRYDNFRYHINRGKHRWKQDFSRQNNYYEYNDCDYNYPQGNYEPYWHDQDGGYSYENPAWNQSGYQKSWWPSRDQGSGEQGHWDQGYYGQDFTQDDRFENTSTDSHQPDTIQYLEKAQEVDETKREKSSWKGKNELQKHSAKESPAVKGGKRSECSTPNTTPISQLSKKVKTVALSSGGPKTKLLQSSSVRSKTLAKKLSPSNFGLTGRRSQPINSSSSKSADHYRSLLSSPSQSPSRDFLKQSPAMTNYKISEKNTRIIVDDGRNIDKYAIQTAESTIFSCNFVNEADSSRSIKMNKNGKIRVSVKGPPCVAEKKKVTFGKRPSTLSDGSASGKSSTVSSVVEKAEALCKELREKREMSKLEREKKQNLHMPEEQKSLGEQSDPKVDRSDVGAGQMLLPKTASGEISTRLSSAVAARTAEFCDPSLTKTVNRSSSWAAGNSTVLSGNTEELLSTKGVASVVVGASVAQSSQDNGKDSTVHCQDMNSLCIGEAGVHKDKSSVANTSTCISSQLNSGTPIKKKDALLNLVNEPRSRKERHRVAEMLRKHSKSQCKRPVSVANLHLSGMYDELPEPQGEVKLENLPSDLQLKIADLIEGTDSSSMVTVPLMDDQAANNSDIPNSDDDLRSLLSFQFASLSDVSNILNGPMKPEPPVFECMAPGAATIQAISFQHSSDQTNRPVTSQLCSVATKPTVGTKKQKSKIKKIPQKGGNYSLAKTLQESKSTEDTNLTDAHLSSLTERNDCHHAQGVSMSSLTTPAYSRLGYVSRVLEISIREEELRKNVASVNTKIDALRKLIHNYSLQLGQYELQKTELLKHEEALRNERMKILKEAVSGSAGDKVVDSGVSGARHVSSFTALNMDTSRLTSHLDKPVRPINFTDTMETDCPMIKQEPASPIVTSAISTEMEPNSFFRHLTESQELLANVVEGASAVDELHSHKDLVANLKTAACNTQNKAKKFEKIKKSTVKNCVELQPSEMEVLKEKLGLSDVEPPLYCMQYMGTLKPGDDKETILSKFAATLIESQKSSLDLDSSGNSGINPDFLPAGDNIRVNDSVGSTLTTTAGRVKRRERNDGTTTPSIDDPKSKEFFLSCIEHSIWSADVNIPVEEQSDCGSPSTTAGREIKHCAIVLERLDLQAEELSGAECGPKELNFGSESDICESLKKATSHECSKVMAPPVSTESSDSKKRLKTRKQRNQMLNGKSSCIVDSSSDTNTQEGDSAGQRPRKKARWTGKKKAVRKCSNSPEKRELQATLRAESSTDVEINGLDKSTAPTQEAILHVWRDKAVRVADDQIEINTPRLRDNTDMAQSEAVTMETLRFVSVVQPITSLRVFKGYVYVCYDGFKARKYDFEAKRSCHVQEYDSGSIHIHCLDVTSKSQGPNYQERVFLGGNGKTLIAFDSEMGFEVGAFKFGDKIQCLHSRWGHLFIGLNNGGVMIFDLKKNKTLGAYRCSTSPVSSISSTTEGVRKIICVASQDASIGVYDASSGMLLRALSCFTSIPLFIQTQDQILFSVGEDKKAMMHNICSGELQHEFCDALGPLMCLAYVQMGNSPFLLTAGSDKLIRCYNLESKKLAQMYYGADKSSITSMAIFDEWILTGNGEGAIEAIQFKPHDLFQCPHCGYVFGLTDHLMYHIKTDHCSPNLTA